MKETITKPEITFLLTIGFPLVAIAISWGVLTTRIDHQERLVLGLQDEYSEQRSTNESIKITLAEIQKDILYIRTELDKQTTE